MVLEKKTTSFIWYSRTHKRKQIPSANVCFKISACGFEEVFLRQPLLSTPAQTLASPNWGAGLKHHLRRQHSHQGLSADFCANKLYLNITVAIITHFRFLIDCKTYVFTRAVERILPLEIKSWRHKWKKLLVVHGCLCSQVCKQININVAWQKFIYTVLTIIISGNKYSHL